MNVKKQIVVFIEKDYNNSKTSYKSIKYKEDKNKGCLYKTINDFTIVILPKDSQISPNSIESNFDGNIVKVIYSNGHPPQKTEWQNHQCKKALESANVFGSKGIKTTLLKKDLKQTDIQQILNDPLIIIFTLEGATPEDYPEWDKAKKLLENSKGKGYDQILQSSSTNLRIAEFTKCDYTILFVKENGLEKKNAQGGIDDLLEKILDKWGRGLKKEDIYVAVHGLKDYLKDESKFKNRVAYICDFHHYEGESPEKYLCDLFMEFLNNFKEETCKEIIEIIKKLALRPIIKALTKLKNDIWHLFLNEYYNFLCQKEKDEKLKLKNSKITFEAKKIIDDFFSNHMGIPLNRHELKNIFSFPHNENDISEIIRRFDDKINSLTGGLK